MKEAEAPQDTCSWCESWIHSTDSTNSSPARSAPPSIVRVRVDAWSAERSIHRFMLRIAPPLPKCGPLPEPIDPTRYSLDPNASIQTMNDDAEVEDVTKQWSGGSTDFSFEEE